MRAILLASSLSLTLSLIGTPLVIRFFRHRGYGQLIRHDGPQSHMTKRGTPTMGGTAIIAAALIGYGVATLVFGPALSPGGLLAMGVFAGMGAVGFVDDYIKLKRRRSLGLTKTAKFGGQAIIAGLFAYGAQYVAETSTVLSWIGTTGLDFGAFFPVFCFLILSGYSNAVNLTDGLDGLAAGTSAFVFGAYTMIAFWIFRHPEQYAVEAWLHADAVAIAAASAAGGVLGFLWWNAPPARIFMGDTGSLAIGGMLAALAVLTETELLLVLLGGLFVIITLSVILQVASFRLFGTRIFKMAPLQHHFELSGWQETTIIVRFWIIGGLATALGLGVFYADFLTFRGGIG
ncbi:MAG: phospho-N-acetylmuramoyl-pentapeptide-transferase [Nitriliruptorales bacterium]|nr:phospho-N-acetylmuramoyl-pentapeptide-transferase [Nitriliruptorales bacterium]